MCEWRVWSKCMKSLSKCLRIDALELPLLFFLRHFLDPCYPRWLRVPRIQHLGCTVRNHRVAVGIVDRAFLRVCHRIVVQGRKEVLGAGLVHKKRLIIILFPVCFGLALFFRGWRRCTLYRFGLLFFNRFDWFDSDNLLIEWLILLFVFQLLEEVFTILYFVVISHFVIFHFYMFFLTNLRLIFLTHSYLTLIFHLHLVLCLLW